MSARPEDLIANIHADLDVRNNVTPAVPYEVGAIGAEVMPDSPRIVWVESGELTIEASERYGGRDTIGTVAHGYVIHIWGRTAEQARSLLFNLMQSCREASDGLPVTFTSGTVINENTGEFAKRDYLLTINATLRLPISSTPYQVGVTDPVCEYDTITLATAETPEVNPT